MHLRNATRVFAKLCASCSDTPTTAVSRCFQDPYIQFKSIAMSQPEQSQNQEEDGYQVSGPLLVNKLQEAGINPQDIKKLADNGLNTVEAVAYTPKKALMQIKGISEQKADKILAEGEQDIPLDARRVTYHSAICA